MSEAGYNSFSHMKLKKQFKAVKLIDFLSFRYEIMDGAPVKGESIPIRVFLAGYDLTPTMRDINKKFSVRYYLNLVLVDEEDRRYFKQQVS